jgi:hypothetical protein
MFCLKLLQQVIYVRFFFGVDGKEENQIDATVTVYW